eukprot:scaffold6915_cov170-Amphora_coffeaeformis.AAC.15
MTTRSATVDTSRFFANPYANEIVKLSRDECLRYAQTLLGKSQLHYSHANREMRQFGSLYNGALGAFVFIPWKLAALHRKRGNKVESDRLLKDALQCADTAMEFMASPSYRRVTLLESPWVGAKVLQIAIWQDLNHSDKAKMEADSLVTQIVKSCEGLPPQECDVLYGRAGAIQALLFLRQALNRTEIGQESVLQLADDILREGHRYAALHQHDGLPLLWEWHESKYLGAAHGVVGILHTLLSLTSSELAILDERHDVHKAIRMTIEGLKKYCLSSGNLDSSIKGGSHCRVDRLVHWCHGATGHILLLMKANEIYGGDGAYQKLALKLAKEVVWTRGLLRKGVELCHGISGNAYALLATGRNDTTMKHYGHAFARFALDHFDQLEGVPDEPYCLFNGVPGLVALLVDLADDHDKARFPLYDYA